MDAEMMKLIIPSLISGVGGFIVARTNTKSDVAKANAEHTQLLFSTYKSDLEGYKNEVAKFRQENAELNRKLAEVLEENRDLKNTVENLREEIANLSTLIKKENLNG